MDNPEINIGTRAESLRVMRTQTLDLLVIGAGATGCGTALDAAARGLTVGIIDKGDIAGGTSSRSSSLVHGGLRYLKQGDLPLVREALRERDLLLTRVAPHLVQLLAFTLPLRHRVWERVYLGAGLLLYDLLGGSRALPRHRHLSRRAVLARFPGLDPGVVVGGLSYFDGHMDDARMALAIARTAVGAGAHLATRVEVTGRASTTAGGHHRVKATDVLSGDGFEIRARSIAVCAGAWTPVVASLLVPSVDAVDVVRSKGVHLRLPRSAISGETALIVASGRSVLLLLPSPDHWLVGTTDTPWSGSTDNPTVSPEDIAFLLDAMSHVLARPVTPDEVTYSFAGLRPLAAAPKAMTDTTRIGREHQVERLAPGIHTIVGGKWTTYRVMARDMVDQVMSEAGLPSVPCTTDSIPLVGSWNGGPDDMPGGLTPQVGQTLRRRYGGTAAEVAQLMAGTGQDVLLGTEDFYRADVMHACVNEGALTLDDVIDRRLRLRLHLDDLSVELVSEVAEVMADALGWTVDETASAVDAYLGQSATQ